ncbi:MAG: ribose-phosphate diphosphokinase [Holosporaceae bacterium]|jgi:ribose-phosphate pyrophosphokinase|nr:ribose-phosphate diphosphokinase [Holosporaceae bacterium]
MKILVCRNACEFASNLTNVEKSDIFYTTASNFEDGELLVKINDGKKLQGQKVLIIQSISGAVNDAFMELAFAMDTVRACAAEEIYLLVTYLGYSRQDRVETPAESFSSKTIASFLSRDYVKRLFLINLHAPQTLGFFSVPSVNFSADELLLEKIKEKYNPSDVVLISPDTGNAKSVISIANKLNADYAVAMKCRPAANESKILSIIGSEVKGKICVILDDIVDSAGTLCNVAAKLAEQGAKEVTAYVTHPVLSKKAIGRINESRFSKLYVGDTISSKEKIAACEKIETFSVADWHLRKILEMID